MLSYFVAMCACAQPEFMAPEALQGREYTASVDWWSLGCLCCEMLTGSTPWFEQDQKLVDMLIKILNKPIVVPSHEHVGPAEVEFIGALLTRDPVKRLGSGPHGHMGVLGHPWFHEQAMV